MAGKPTELASSLLFLTAALFSQPVPSLLFLTSNSNLENGWTTASPTNGLVWKGMMAFYLGQLGSIPCVTKKKYSGPLLSVQFQLVLEFPSSLFIHLTVDSEDSSWSCVTVISWGQQTESALRCPAIAHLPILPLAIPKWLQLYINSFNGKMLSDCYSQEFC